jgi:hypothetical protein
LGQCHVESQLWWLDHQHQFYQLQRLLAQR